MTEQIDSIYIKYVLTGECEVNVNEVIRKWDEHCLISQWHQQYKLCMGNPDKYGEGQLKAIISKRQAKEIIVELDLMPIQSEIFKNGKSWRKQ